MELDLDVRLETLGRFCAWWEGNILGGKEGECEGYGRANDGAGFGGVIFLGCERGAVS